MLVEIVGAAGLLDPSLVHHHLLAGDVHRLRDVDRRATARID